MSVCKTATSGGRKRHHDYGDTGNTCTKCGHITTHGKRYRESLIKPEKK